MTYVGGLGVRNDSSGLLYMRQSYYDPQLGRWLSADPIGFAGGLNKMGYCAGDPINSTDPSGLDVVLWVRVTKKKSGGDWGHAWLQITGPGYYEGFGSYPGPGIVDENTENYAEVTRKVTLRQAC